MFRSFFKAALVITLVLIIGGCTDLNSPGERPILLRPIRSKATDIKLYIYSNGLGNVIDSMQLDNEGDVIIDVDEEDPYIGGPSDYYIYALANGYYTEMYTCDKGESINVDLDSVPQRPNSIAGTLIVKQGYFMDSYIASKPITIVFSDGQSYEAITDEQGRFGVANAPLGTCNINFEYAGESFSLTMENTTSANYEDLSIIDPIQVDAPVVYLYPEEEMNIDVKIDLHSRGRITESEPEYGDGWSVYATPEGLINGMYPYLFYEAVMSVPLNHKEGWLLEGANLESELRSLLKEYGFIGKEIDDFMEFWLPIITGSSWYAVYPQDADELITLDITPVPDNVLRGLFLIRPLDQPINIIEPSVPDNFERHGFTVVEWGVVGWPGNVGH